MIADIRIVARISEIRTVSLASQLSWRQPSKTTFSQLLSGWSVATTRPGGS